MPKSPELYPKCQRCFKEVQEKKAWRVARVRVVFKGEEMCMRHYKRARKEEQQ